MPQALLRCPLMDYALPYSCLVPQPDSLAAWAASLLPGASFADPACGSLCLQKLGLKTPGSPRGRYLKVDWVGQS